MINSRLLLVALLALQVPLALPMHSDTRSETGSAASVEESRFGRLCRTGNEKQRKIQEYLGTDDGRYVSSVIPITVGYTVEGENKDRALYSKEILWAHAGMLLYSLLYGAMQHDVEQCKLAQADDPDQAISFWSMRNTTSYSHGMHHARKAFCLYLGTVLAARLVRHGYNFWMGPARRQAKKVVSMVQNAEPARQGAAA